MKIVQAKPLSEFAGDGSGDGYRVQPLDVSAILRRLAAAGNLRTPKRHKRKLLFSGEPAPASGHYEMVRLTGDTRYVTKGVTMPPTPEPGMAFVRVRISN